MNTPPLLSLKNISLTFGGTPVFEDITAHVLPFERVCLVGRNGSGKSTLMKIMAGLIKEDQGERFVQPGASVVYLPQNPDITQETLGEYAAEPLTFEERYKVDILLEELNVDPKIPTQKASGGERRRASLVRALAQDADVLLLDEPTNHLDIKAIEWLESYLQSYRGSFVLISHDRLFLSKLTRNTLWLDRGVMRMYSKGFEAFEEWRDSIFEEEDAARHKLKQLIKSESRWAVEGISARRKRNQGRLRRLQDLRKKQSSYIKRQSVSAVELEDSPTSGKVVTEARKIHKAFQDKTIVKDFSIKITRGERIGFVGANGMGKTTLVQLLLGQIEPDQGSVKVGKNQEVAIFDQHRMQVNPNQSLWDSLTHDPSLAVQGAGDHVMVRGNSRHVAGYLKEFLFTNEQFRSPVSVLSGGERARLLLAKLLARDSNLFVLDEPTNDLDFETLDLLQEILDEYTGTVMLISHDRDFLDRVCSRLVVFEGNGQVNTYAGGWQDYLAQRTIDPFLANKAVVVKEVRDTSKQTAKPSVETLANALSFVERHRLEQLPAEIEKTELEIKKLVEYLAQADLYTKDPKNFDKASAALVERQVLLEELELEWMSLLDKKEAL
jgi:ABC transport system ATP-binding/permease protein